MTVQSPRRSRLRTPIQRRGHALPGRLAFGAARSPCRGSGFAEGRAPHARGNGIRLTRACLPWALGSSFTPGNHDTLRLASSLPTRTRRPRPSEKTPLRAISGPSPQGHLTLAHPPGGAGSARPRGTLPFHRGTAPLGHRPLVCPSVIMLSLGSSTASPRGRAERVPPRKSPLA